MARKLSLSQCMIVKDEEENIRRALSWGQGIVCEQIVVDTGSVDKTVAIAESMGAKVYHYKWENDFAAAKNFAISKATGDWIAFLDADEYFLEEGREGVKKLLTFLAGYPTEQQPEAIRCDMMHLGEAGNIFSTTKQDRFFRNSGKIFYKNRIHEILTHTSGRKLLIYDIGGELPIYHTGYATGESLRKNKGKRNLDLLYKEVEEEPDRYELWSYIGDALLAQGSFLEGLAAYRKVVDHPEADIDSNMRLNAFANCSRLMGLDSHSTEADIEELYQKYSDLGIVHPDMEYWTGMNYYRYNRKKECIRYLEKALVALEGSDFSFTLYVSGQLEQVYRMLTELYADQKDSGKAVRYAVLALRTNRYLEDTLCILLKLFMENKEAAAGVYSFLGKIYQFGSSKDVFFVYKAAKVLKFYHLEDYIYHTLSQGEREFLEEKKQSPWRLSREAQAEKYPSFVCKNETDARFLELLEEISGKDDKTLTKEMIAALEVIKKEDKHVYDNLVEFYEKHTWWGRLAPQKEDYETFDLRAQLLTKNRERFLKLYTMLADYRSKRVLNALLESWMHLTKESLLLAAESNPQVFDPDLIVDAQGKMLVDFWATEGNDVKSFLQAYGDAYERILCYVKTEEDELRLRCNLRGVKRLEVIRRDPESVSLDKDISGSAGIIRIQGEGEEKELLDCCSAQLAAYRPALVVSAYYGYETLFVLAERILQINPSYRLYLRYYGDALVPSDYYLIAV